MSNDESSPKDESNGPPYDLGERASRFGEAVIDFAKGVPVSPVTVKLIEQVVRASGSIGANYAEANDAGSRKEFRHRISLCRRESAETKHWLRLIVRADADRADAARSLWQEAKELNLIFGRIYRSSGGK